MRVRLFGFLLFALVSSPGYANPHGWRPIGIGPNPAMLLEHLVNHADKLVTNINLTRTNGFRIQPVLIQTITAAPCHSASFYNDVLVTSAAVQKGGPDAVGFEVGQLAKNFSIRVIQLNEIALAVGPSQLLATFWDTEFSFAYYNAISAANFYLDALIRGQRLNPWPWAINNPALLQRRIDLLRNNIATILDLVYEIRYAAIFRFPLMPNCIECSFAPRRIGIGPGAPGLVFPYYANNAVVFPAANVVAPMQAPQQFQNNYQVQQWSNTWGNVDQSYMNQGGAPGMPGGQGGFGGQPGVGQGGFGGQPGVGQGGFGGQPGVGQGGFGGQPGVGQGGIGGQPGIVGQPGVVQPGIGGQPGVGQPGIGGQPGVVVQPGVGQPGIGGQPGVVVQPGVGQPGIVGQPGVVQPGIGGQPGVVQQPGVGQPRVGQPNQGYPLPSANVPAAGQGRQQPLPAAGGQVTPQIPTPATPVPDKGFKPGAYDY